MPDERRNFSIGASEGDTSVDTACEVGDPVLEVVVGDLHDVCNRWAWSVHRKWVEEI